MKKINRFILSCLLLATTITQVQSNESDSSKQQYDFIIGEWTCSYIQYADGKVTAEYPCTWQGKHTFDGNMVQDDFRMYFKEKLVFAGTTLRTWVERKQRWDLAFLGAGQGHWPNFHGVWQDSQMNITATGEDQRGKFESKIHFKDIKKDSYLWEMHKSYDEGKTWNLDAQIKTTRKL